VYYDIVKSGMRVKELCKAAVITRQNLAEQVGISVDALRKIEQGINGAKIDTLVAIAEIFHVSLDYLICGSSKEIGIERIVAGLNEAERQFIRRIVLNAVENMELLRK
jgi:transcriptional regulator with XRE-family HTH domain